MGARLGPNAVIARRHPSVQVPAGYLRRDSIELEQMVGASVISPTSSRRQGSNLPNTRGVIYKGSASFISMRRPQRAQGCKPCWPWHPSLRMLYRPPRLGG